MVMMASRSRHRTFAADEGEDVEDPVEAPAATSRGRGSTKKSNKEEISNDKSLDKESDEYRRKRERNNLAVKKSRSKSKIKTQETLERVNKLRAENEMLEAKIQLLSKELGFLKDLFLAHAGNVHSQALQDLDLTMFGEPTAEGLALTANVAAQDKTVPVKAE